MKQLFKDLRGFIDIIANLIIGVLITFGTIWFLKQDFYEYKLNNVKVIFCSIDNNIVKYRHYEHRIETRIATEKDICVKERIK